MKTGRATTTQRWNSRGWKNWFYLGETNYCKEIIPVGCLDSLLIANVWSSNHPAVQHNHSAKKFFLQMSGEMRDNAVVTVCRGMPVNYTRTVLRWSVYDELLIKARTSSFWLYSFKTKMAKYKM